MQKKLIILLTSFHKKLTISQLFASTKLIKATITSHSQAFVKLSDVFPASGLSHLLLNLII